MIHPDALDPTSPRHGTVSLYNQGCRCDKCRAGKAAYSRAWRNRNGCAPWGNIVAHKGKRYPSQAAAARALGVSERTIAYHLERYGHLDNLGKKMRRPDRETGKPVCIGTRSWPSRAAFGRYVGVTPDAARNWFERGDMQRIIAALMKADSEQQRVAA